MARISSFGQSSLLLQSALRNQGRLFTSQQQVATGKKAHSFQEMSPRVQEAMSARQSRFNTQNFRETIQSVRQNVDIYDVQLGTITNAARNLKQATVTAVGQNDAAGYISILEQTFDLVSSALTTRLNGNFIFGGTRTDQSPLSITSLAELQALPISDDAFLNDQKIKTALVADEINMEFGQLADDVAADIMASLKRIADFNSGPFGPLTGALTPAQSTFLEGEINLIEQAVQKAQTAQTRNGLISNRLDIIDDQHQTSLIFLEQLVSDIEDVNLAEAITQLQQDQMALEVSFQAISTLSHLSLLNFL